jgi:hypothetical protein
VIFADSFPLKFAPGFEGLDKSEVSRVSRYAGVSIAFATFSSWLSEKVIENTRITVLARIKFFRLIIKAS